MMGKEQPSEKSLGLVELPSGTFEHDLAISSNYQSFSAELLRLALLGIAAIGFLISNAFLSQTTHAIVLSGSSSFWVKFYLVVSLGCFGLSAACALAHRYLGPDSVAYHLELLRRTLGHPNDIDMASKARKKRNWRFKWSVRVLFASGLLLWLGAISLAICFVKVLVET